MEGGWGSNNGKILSTYLVAECPLSTEFKLPIVFLSYYKNSSKLSHKQTIACFIFNSQKFLQYSVQKFLTYHKQTARIGIFFFGLLRKHKLFVTARVGRMFTILNENCTSGLPTSTQPNWPNQFGFLELWSTVSPHRSSLVFCINFLPI